VLRSWPMLQDNEALIVRYPRSGSLANVIVTGMFFLFGAMSLFLGIRSFFQKPTTNMMVFGVVVLAIFVMIVGLFMVLNLRNFIGESDVRFVANREGLFLDITTHRNQAFFLSWKDIDKFRIRKVSDPFWGPGGWKTRSDTLSILIKPSANIQLPKIVKNVAAIRRNEINLNSYTLDISLEEAVSKLTEMKERFVVPSDSWEDGDVHILTNKS